MKKILFPTDFSTIAQNAFEYALDLAERLDAGIVLVHAYQYATADELYVPAEMIEALTMEKEDEALKHFERYEAQVQSKRGRKVPVEHVLRYGFATEVITACCKEQDPYMIVMGTKGTSGITEKLLGSVASHVIQHANRPVLAIPDEARFAGIHHITYATTFDEQEFKVIDGLLAFAKLFDAQISCVHIQQKTDKWIHLQHDFFRNIYSNELSHEKMDFFILNSEEVVEGLSHFAMERESDVIAMLTHKRTAFSRLFHPSITRKVALHSEIPLLAFHNKE